MENQEPDAASMAERTSKLPDEILATQQARSDLLKWKLVLVAALGAAGFGLEEKIAPTHLLLALIPLVCLYVDLLCTNLNLRLIVIGTYYASFHEDIYEGFVAKNRRAFDLEDWALYWSTIVVSVLVSIVGLTLTFPSSPTAPESPGSSVTASAPAGSSLTISIGQAGKESSPVKPASTGDNVFTRPGVQGWILVAAGIVGIASSLVIKSRYKARTKLWTPRIDLYRTFAVHNEHIRPLLRPQYTSTELETLYQFLARQGAFDFRDLPTGLFAASDSAHSGDASGYHFVWVRDNIHIAHAHLAWGETRMAVRTASGLLAYFQKHRQRFVQVIEGQTDPADPMNRPHVRFDGEALAEVAQKWPHAQNDALGYFLWFYCKLAQQDLVPGGAAELECLTLFPVYFRAIRYWQDADSGHWEEARKVSASSIGTVLAGLRELSALLRQRRRWFEPVANDFGDTLDLIEQLRSEGKTALGKILPYESIEPSACVRRYDSALLFLIYPLDVLEQEQANRVLHDVRTRLQGSYGVRRYLGDSYWCADYKDKLAPEVRTGDFSENMATRDALGQVGEEAQWCIFDPIISAIYGERFRRLQKIEDWRLQAHYFNRTLGHLTGGGGGLPEFSLPEAYYLEKGRYVPNDHTPLLWAQANLWLAFHEMQLSAKLVER
jgi:hypothetical protein